MDDASGLSWLRRINRRIRWKLDRRKRWVADLRREAAAEHARTRETLGAEVALLRLQLEEERRRRETTEDSFRSNLQYNRSELAAGLEALEARLDGEQSLSRSDSQALRSEIAALAESQRVERAERLGQISLLEHVVAAQAAPGFGGGAAASTGPPPLVSVTMPAYNRARLAPVAIASVVAQSMTNWELFVIDDGSQDDLEAAVRPFLADSRIRLIRQAHRGSAAARNEALRRARGSIVAHLDTDNVWTRDYLLEATAALQANPDVDLVYGALATDDHGLDQRCFLFRPYDRKTMMEYNYIDINVVAHRTALYEKYGGFDETLDRVIDWDLLLRYTRDKPPLAIPFLAARYGAADPKRISSEAVYGPNWVRIKQKWYPPEPLRRPLRVLYVVWHYPQLSETYIETELRCMRRWGVQIEVWRPEDVASPYATDTPIHTGTLGEAVEAVRPDLIHIHWVGFALSQDEALAKFGLPVTLRMHGFDTTADSFRLLMEKPWLRGVYPFPKQVALLSSPDDRVKAVPVAFESALFRPRKDKDRRLVVRASAALPSKDVGFFFELAGRLPEFRFVYAGVTCKNLEHCVGEIKDLHASLQSPADLRFDVPHEEIAELMGSAGIHLHTAVAAGAPNHTPFGQPASIAEGMATGAYTLARACPEFEDYVGDAGALYGDADEAARLIRATLSWSDEDWRRLHHRAVDRAFRNYADEIVTRTIFEDWRRIAGERQPEDSAGEASSTQIPSLSASR